jgi:anti-sigma regulatory factor (Ser/Thr protein kinase)
MESFDPIPPDPARPAAQDTAVRRPAVAASVTGMRWAARDFALENGADEGLAGDVMLAVSEAVTNSIKHAYPGRAGEVELVGSLTADRTLVVTVSDSGDGFGPNASEGLGAGLMLMGECADELEVDKGPGGVTVRMVFHLQRPLA